MKHNELKSNRLIRLIWSLVLLGCIKPDQTSSQPICARFTSCNCDKHHDRIYATCHLDSNLLNSLTTNNSTSQLMNNDSTIFFLKFLVSSKNTTTTTTTQLPDGLLNGYDIDMLHVNNLGLVDLNPRAFEGVLKISCLYLSENQLEHIDFASLPNVTTEKIEALILNKNRLVRIPKLLSRARFPHLTTLDLASNKIVNLTSDELEDLDAPIVDLDLSDNLIRVANLSEFSSGLSGSLERLRLNGNQIRRLSVNVSGSFPNLNYLSLYKNKLSTLEVDTFAELPSLETLDLSSNFLVYLPVDVFKKLTRLEALNLAYNRLSELRTREFDRLDALVQLELQHNRLKRVSLDWFANLVNLNILDLSFNRIETIETPPGLVFSNLNILRLNGNKLKVCLFFQI